MKSFKIVNMKKFMRSIVILNIIILSIIFLLAKVSFSHNDETTMNYDTITISTGDTLWQIALLQQQINPYYETKDVRDIIAHIKKINQLQNSNLKVGQILKVPTI